MSGLQGAAFVTAKIIVKHMLNTCMICVTPIKLRGIHVLRGRLPRYELS